MTRSDIAALLVLLAFLALFWAVSLIVRVARIKRRYEDLMLDRVVRDAAEVIESVDGRPK